MTKNEQSQKSNDGAKNRSGGRNHSSKLTSQSKALLKIKRAKRNEHKIKASFKDSEGNDIKEMVYTFRDGDPPELLFELEKQLLKLGDRYDLFEGGRWKVLCQIGGRALEGRCEKYWSDIVESARNHNAGDALIQRKKFKKLIQKVNSKYLGKEAIDDQRDAMEFGELKYEGHDHTGAVERLFEINDDLELFGEDADKFSDREMARRVIPKNLKTAASLKFYDKGGDELRDRNDILELCRRITTLLRRESDANNQPNNRNGGRDRTNQGATNNANNRERKNAAPCRKHNGAHTWGECPNNWRNQNSSGNGGQAPPRTTSSSSAPSSKKRGEVKSTESQSSTNEAAIVHFESDCESDDESYCSSHASRGELMEIGSKTDSQNLHPITIITLLDNHKKRVACKVLLDQCCTDKGLISWDMAKALNIPAIPSSPKTFATANGTFSSTEVLKLEGAMLPCLSTNRTFSLELMILPKECSHQANYGVIIGQETMRLLDLDTSVRENTISWGECEIGMVSRDHWTPERIVQQKPRLLRQPQAEQTTKSTKTQDEILATEALAAAKYVKADLDHIVEQCAHLNAEQKGQLLTVLRKHKDLFQGKRGNWKGQPVSFEVIDGAVPVWSRPYPTPLKNREIFKNEVYRQCEIGAMRELTAEEVEEREWASPCFGIPKKDGTIRLVMDFRRINSVLKRKEYPLPTIDEMFQNIRGFVFASTIDLNMGYLSIPLTEATQALLTIVTTFGFFQPLMLPMGARPATDIFQARMVGIFLDMQARKPSPYLDDIFHGKGNCFNSHLAILDEIFHRLENAGMQVNLTKSTLCAKEVEFLGFLLKETGFQPTRKRVEAIMKIAPPKNVKKIREFLGAINFIKNHIPNRAGILAPITNLTKKDVPFIWGEKEQEAFDKVKAEISNAILCIYPNPNKRFIVYPDASQKYAMGAMLTQESHGTEHVISTFSRKFNDAQLKYTVGEQELLAAHEACRFFHDIIYGCEILIRCDHKNLTNLETKHTNLRVLRQRLTLDQEYGAKFEHLAGELNTGADGLSRLPMTDEIPASSNAEIYAIDELNRDANYDFPLSMKLLKEEQIRDEKIQEALQKHGSNNRISTLNFGTTSVHTIDGKVMVPATLQHRIIDWYHNNLRHPGSTRTLNSIAQTFYWKGMRSQIEEHIRTCDQCQRHKIVGKPNYGILPLVPALRDKKPFEKVHVDCAGPWTIKLNDGPRTANSKYEIFVLTMVDACTNWAEFALIPTASSRTVAIQFDINWLCRYPRPTEVGYDNGKEFIGEEFQELLVSYDIMPKPTTIKNPTAQALVERLHLTLGDHLRTSVYTLDDWSNEINHLLQSCAWAIRTTVPSNAPHNPSQLVFGMDMIFRQQAKIDWQLLKRQRRLQAIANNKKENKNRKAHEYKTGDLVLIVQKPYERKRKAKLSSPTEGPFPILQVHSNGNVRIQRGNFQEDISIRRLRPYYPSN
jgi:hypothetical protein